MSTEILQKLTRELDVGITTEVQVVYLLAGIRKLIERDGVREQYKALNFHCDWALHAYLDRAGAKEILQHFDAAHGLMKAGDRDIDELPEDLRDEIYRISKMRSFYKELRKFSDVYHLPHLHREGGDAWAHFLHLYAKVIQDMPLKLKAPGEHISRVTVRCEVAPEPKKREDGSEVMFFYVFWTIHDDKTGKSGDLFTINTFTVKAAD